MDTRGQPAEPAAAPATLRLNAVIVSVTDTTPQVLTVPHPDGPPDGTPGRRGAGGCRMNGLAPLRRLQYEPLVRAALLEDLGVAGDLTTDAIVDPSAHAAGVQDEHGQGGRASRPARHAPGDGVGSCLFLVVPCGTPLMHGRSTR